MGLLTGLLTLPLAPVRGVVWIAERIQEEAERVQFDRARIRERFAELDEAHDAGELSDVDYADLRQELLDRLLRRGDNQ